MSETKGAAMSETAVERLDAEITPIPASDVGIRIKFHKGGGYTLWDKRKGPPKVMVLVPEDEAQAGREAIRILADWENDETPQDGPSRKWKARVAALLARCEGE